VTESGQNRFGEHGPLGVNVNERLGNCCVLAFVTCLASQRTSQELLDAWCYMASPAVDQPHLK
jgi:hypothetical protein